MTPAVTHPHRAEFDQALQGVRDQIMEMGALVEQALARGMWALRDRAPDLCSAVVEDDVNVNELQRRVRESSFTLILTQQPVATDLREILSLLHIAAELERMGDHAVSIAKIVRRISDLPPLHPAVDLAPMADLCQRQVREILGAVLARDIDRARQVAARDDRIDRVYHRLFSALLERIVADGESAYRATELVFVARHLERVADRVTNIAEDLVFQATGLIEELG